MNKKTREFWQNIENIKNSPLSCEILDFLRDGRAYFKVPSHRERVAAVEIHNQQRIFFYGDAVTASKHYPALTFHEVIGQCKFFVDVDDHGNKYTREQFNEKITKLTTEFKKAAKDKKVDIYITRGTYNSAHIFFEVFNKDGALEVFKNPGHQGEFWRKFGKSTGLSDVIDLSVYKRNAQLRGIGSPKYNMPETEHEAYTCDYERTEANLSFLATVEGIEKISIIEYKQEKREYTAYELYMLDEALKLATPRELNGSQGVYLIVKAMRSIYLRETEEKQYLRICELLAKIGHGDKVEMAKSLFYQVEYMPVSVEWFINLLGIEFFEWDEVYDEPVVRYLPDLPKSGEIEGIDGNEYIDILQLPGYCQARERIRKVQVVKSTCDTQKTRQIFFCYKDYRILFVNYRISLTNDIISKEYNGIKVASYQDEEVQENLKNGRCPQYLSIQLDSLWRVRNCLGAYDIVIFDEAPMVIGHFTYTHSKSHFFNKIMDTFTEIMRTKNLIFMSANINFLVFSLIRSFLGAEKIHCSLNTAQIKKWNITHYADINDFYFKIIDLVKTGKRICVATNSKSKAISLYLLLICKINAYRQQQDRETEGRSVDICPKRVKIITSDTEHEAGDVNESWLKYDVVIFTPTIESGVSFSEAGHFDHIAGLFINNSNNHLAIFQQLIRCRNPKKNKVFIYCQNTHFNIEKVKKLNKEGEEVTKKIYIPLARDPLTKTAAKMRTYMREYYKKSNQSDINPFHIIDLQNPFYKAIMLNQLFDSYSTFKLRTHLKKELAQAGITWGITIGPSEDAIENMKYMKAGLKALRIAFYLEVLTAAHIKVCIDSEENKYKIIKAEYVKLQQKHEASKKPHSLYAGFNMDSFLEKQIYKIHKMGIITENKISDVVNITKGRPELINTEWLYYKVLFCLEAEAANPGARPINPINNEPLELTPLTQLAYTYIKESGFLYYEGEKCKMRKYNETDFDKFNFEFLSKHNHTIEAHQQTKKANVSTKITNDARGQASNYRKINALLKAVNFKITRLNNNSQSEGYRTLKIQKCVDFKTISPYKQFNKEYINDMRECKSVKELTNKPGHEETHFEPLSKIMDYVESLNTMDKLMPGWQESAKEGYIFGSYVDERPLCDGRGIMAKKQPSKITAQEKREFLDLLAHLYKREHGISIEVNKYSRGDLYIDKNIKSVVDKMTKKK